MFTVLSKQLAGVESDSARIAAQIIPGIGFIGAGSILHAKTSVTGLTTAATLFVVASVGMAAGGGLYLTACFATVLILIALVLLGRAEAAFSLKMFATSYEVTGGSVEEITQEVNRILEHKHRMMQNVLTGNTGQHVRLTLKGLSQSVGMSPHQLERAFLRNMGITPRQYADSQRMRRFKRNLRKGGNVTTALYEAGYGSSSRVYERADAHLGMTPASYGRGGEGISF